MKAVIAGLFGGAIGAVVWAGVAAVTGYEVGWIAWGIGGLVGYCVAFGNRDGSIAPQPAGIIAVAMAGLSIVAGKYAAVQLLMPDDADIVSMFTAELDDEELLVSYVADDVVTELEAGGATVDWPDGVDPTNATMQAEYPPEVWSVASSRWDELSAEERTRFRDGIEAEIRTNVEAQLPQLRALMGDTGFWSSFGGLDIVFFGLAMVTAFGIGNGSRQESERLVEAFPVAVERALIGVMLCDGEIDEAEVREICEAYHGVSGMPISEEDVRNDAAIIQSQDADPLDELRELAGSLDDESKERIVALAFRVAAADGRLDEAEGPYLAQVARCVGLTRARFQEMLSELAEAGSAA